MDRFRKWGGLLLTLGLLTLGFTPSALAINFDLDLLISFDPPGDSPFSDGTLSGTIAFYQLIPFGDLTLSNTVAATDLGPLAAGDELTLQVSCRIIRCIGSQSSGGGGGGGSSAIEFPGAPAAPDVPILMNFGGVIVPPDPIQPADPMFAYSGGSAQPDGPPGSPPVIDLGALGGGVSSLSASGPIYAFASPGTQVGTWSVRITAVPEPGTLLLLGSGMAGLMALRRKFSA